MNGNNNQFTAGKKYRTGYETIPIHKVEVDAKGNKWVYYTYIGRKTRAKVINAGGNQYCSEWFYAKYSKLQKAVYASQEVAV